MPKNSRSYPGPGDIMRNWKFYHWSEFDGIELPWEPRSDQPVLPFPQRQPVDRLDAEIPVFEAGTTYFTKLARDWDGNKSGARVLVSPGKIAVESP